MQWKFELLMKPPACRSPKARCGTASTSTSRTFRRAASCATTRKRRDHGRARGHQPHQRALLRRAGAALRLLLGRALDPALRSRRQEHRHHRPPRRQEAQYAERPRDRPQGPHLVHQSGQQRQLGQRLQNGSRPPIRAALRSAARRQLHRPRASPSTTRSPTASWSRRTRTRYTSPRAAIRKASRASCAPTRSRTTAASAPIRRSSPGAKTRGACIAASTACASTPTATSSRPTAGK